MVNSVTNSTPKKIAVVTGSNKGIGLEMCRQLLLEGVTVVVTARDEVKGAEALETLQALAPADDVLFHQLDVTDSGSVEAFAVDCLNTNYYGAKRVTEALVPLVLLSQFPRIVNLSSSFGKLQNIPSKDLRKELNDVDTLTVDRLDELAQSFLSDFKRGEMDKDQWPAPPSAYRVSKVLLGAYTRLLAKRFPTMCCNCIDPGFVKMDMNANAGIVTAHEGAKISVAAALLPDGSLSGLFYDGDGVTSYE